MSEKLGTLHKRGSMFLRHHVGEAEQDDGPGYELAADAGTLMPLVRSQKTGLYFSLSWEEIIDLAVKAGIDEEHSQ